MGFEIGKRHVQIEEPWRIHAPGSAVENAQSVLLVGNQRCWFSVSPDGVTISLEDEVANVRIDWSGTVTIG